MSDPTAFVEKLRETLDEARQLALELEQRLVDSESDQQELASRLVESEHQANRLMSLYVALYQLHASLEPALVRAAIADIAVNLLGAESWALLLYEGPDRTADVCIAEASETIDLGRYCIGARYTGGEPAIDAALSDGVLRIAPIAGSTSAAVIPLSCEDLPIGVLTLSKLFDHKPVLAEDDHDLLALLAVHASSALYASEAHAKLKQKRGAGRGAVS
jgi:hypothetical protein